MERTGRNLLWGRTLQRCLSLTFLLAIAVAPAIAQQSSSNTKSVASAQSAIGTPANTPAQPAATPAREAAPDPLLDVPPLPNTEVTLVGGVVTSIDRVRNKLSVEAFGGKKMKFVFDERTHIYRDGVETTQLGIKKGDRVYVDTQLDGTQVFARNIRVENKSGPADAAGQVLSYDASNGTLVLRDQLSSEPVSFRLTNKTAFEGRGSTADLVPGALVKLTFAPDSSDRGSVQRVQIAAKPGETFTFVGEVTFLDISRGVLAIRNQADNKTYEVKFNPSSPDSGALRVGSEATITAAFDGSGYASRSVAVRQAKAQ